MDELNDQLRQQITETLNLDADAWEGVGDDDPLFVGGLGLDSIDALELVVLLERHYNLRISDMASGQQAFASLNAMADYIRRESA